jgi:hypothetical protein
MGQQLTREIRGVVRRKSKLMTARTSVRQWVSLRGQASLVRTISRPDILGRGLLKDLVVRMKYEGCRGYVNL